MVVKLIKNSDTTKYISIDSLVEQLKINNKLLSYIANGSRYSYGFFERKHANLSKIKYNQLENLKTVCRYFIKAFVGTLHRLDICDIGSTEFPVYSFEDLDSLDNERNYYFMDIEYFKLTNLGKYIFDIDKQYKSSSAYKLILNSYSLDLTVDNENSLSELFLKKITTKVSKNRYKTDVKTFMQNINSDVEYENTKKALLEKVDEVPAIWKDFFITIEKRLRSVLIITSSAVMIKINDNKEIAKLIMENTKLKNKILKVQDFHIVVLKENLMYVKKIFKEYGIIL
jgi:hypothetical protein